MNQYSIDVDVPLSFPSAVERRLVEISRMSKVEIVESEGRFIQSLEGHSLRIIHFSRLLPHEFDDVLQGGLNPFSQAFFSRRIQRAVSAGHLSVGQGRELAFHSMYGTNPKLEKYRAAQVPSRANQVWACAGRDILRDPSAFESLQGKWGGEGIYFAASNRADQNPTEPGRPVIIVIDLEIRGAGRPLRFFPLLSEVLSAPHGERFCDVQIFGRVDATEIVRILSPGDAGYDIRIGTR